MRTYGVRVMLGTRRTRTEGWDWVTFGLVIGMLLTALGISRLITLGNSTNLSWPTLGLVMGVIALITLSNWRVGTYLFLLWLVFEDLPRKYLGNNMVIFFGKDLLAAITYLSFFVAFRRSRRRTFRPLFWVPLLLFIWLSLLQMLNPHSPSLFYGLVGVKLYLYYIPLMFLGYALIRSREDLQGFLIFNLAVGGVVAFLGIIQAVVGLDFLNPRTLAPELVPLGQLVRHAPLSGVAVTAPTSVFVSTGRFSWYMLLMFLLGLGATLSPRVVYRSRAVAFIGLGLMAVAIVLSGSRGAFLYSLSGAFILTAASLWARKRPNGYDYPPREVKAVQMKGLLVATMQVWRERPWLRKTTQQVFIVLGVFILGTLLLYPKIVGAHWAFYYETLSPQSPYFEIGRRAWDYPMQNFRNAFENPNWPLGEGIGTASLGTQYVTRYFDLPPRWQILESGYGTLLDEMGIPGLVLWLIWTVALLRACWNVVRRLRNTALFPIAFAIFWFAFLLLFPFTYAGIQPYQNFVFNAYFWLLMGIFFRLPMLVPQAGPTGSGM